MDSIKNMTLPISNSITSLFKKILLIVGTLLPVNSALSGWQLVGETPFSRYFTDMTRWELEADPEDDALLDDSPAARAASLRSPCSDCARAATLGGTRSSAQAPLVDAWRPLARVPCLHPPLGLKYRNGEPVEQRPAPRVWPGPPEEESAARTGLPYYFGTDHAFDC